MRSGTLLGSGKRSPPELSAREAAAPGLSTGSFEDFLQTDAPINQGNSGGALINTKSELIGINSQILSPTGGNIGIGFAIPSDLAKNVMDQLIANGQVHRGQLGVGVQTLTSDLASGLGLKEVRGVLINSVVPGSPADRAGIRNGDVITSIDGHPCGRPQRTQKSRCNHRTDSQVKLSIIRDGKEQQVRPNSVSSPRSRSRRIVRPGIPGAAPADRHIGVSLEPLTSAIAQNSAFVRERRGWWYAASTPADPPRALECRPAM